MERKYFTLLAEPQGDIYYQILDFAVRECNVVLLVVRKSLPLSTHGATVLQQLNDYLITRVESMEWPGTKLLDETASVFRYKFGPECADVIKNATSSLYGWTQPELPEDICLLKDDENTWLVSIAHERDGFFYLSPDEKKTTFRRNTPTESFIERGWEVTNRMSFQGLNHIQCMYSDSIHLTPPP